MEYRELNQENGQPHLLRSIIYWITDIVVVITLAVFVVLFLCQRVRVSGHSMEPMLAAEEEILVDRIRYHFADPERFDIIVFEKENSGTSKTYIKRIVGLPGETVQIVNEEIYINGAQLEGQESIRHVTLSGLAEKPITLAQNEYFVLGDNRESSEDSRFANIGNVKNSEILGSVWMRISPFDRIGRIRNTER